MIQLLPGLRIRVLLGPAGDGTREVDRRAGALDAVLPRCLRASPQPRRSFLPASSTSSWLSGSGEIPRRHVRDQRDAEHFTAKFLGAMVSSVVDMPTRSPPMAPAIRTSAGVSNCGPRNCT